VDSDALKFSIVKPIKEGLDALFGMLTERDDDDGPSRGTGPHPLPVDAADTPNPASTSQLPEGVPYLFEILIAEPL